MLADSELRNELKSLQKRIKWIFLFNIFTCVALIGIVLVAFYFPLDNVCFIEYRL